MKNLIKKTAIDLEVLFAVRMERGQFNTIESWNHSAEIEVEGFYFTLQISNGEVYCEDESYLIIDFENDFPCLKEGIHDRIETIIKNN